MLITSVLPTVSLRLLWFNGVGYDEGIYLLIGRLLAKGTVIYRDIPVNKPPLIFVINAVLSAVGGDLFDARLLVMAVSVLSSILIFYITHMLTNKFRVALFASILFSIFSSLPLSEIFLVLTEPYVIVFELGALYFLVRARLTNDSRNLVFSGALVGLALLTRQTAVLFFSLWSVCLVFWKLKGYFETKSLMYALLGLAVPTALCVFSFGYLGALRPMVYQNTVQAYSDLLPVASQTDLRQLWLFGYFVSSSPLWFLTTLNLVQPKSLAKTISRCNLLPLLVSWVAVVLLFYGVLVGPGFYHEYAETLAPLSILSSFGVLSLSRKLTTVKKRGLVLLAILLLGFLCYVSVNYNMGMGEVFTDDYSTVSTISSYIMRNTQAADRLLVFETQQAKIGPLIYFESNRDPIWLERGFNCLRITDDERDRIVELLKNDDNVTVVIIGGRPPSQLQDANQVYDFIVSNYVIKKEFGLYNPYPGLENLPVTLFTDIRGISYANVTELDLSNFKGASYTIQNGTLELSDTAFPGYTIFSTLNETIDLSNSIASIQITGRSASIPLYLDLVDCNGNLARHEITYSSVWQETRIPINNRTFTTLGASGDFQKIKQVNLVFGEEGPIDVSIKNISFFNVDT